MKQFITFCLCLISFNLLAQQNIGIGTTTPDSSAALDISSTNKGLLIPRMTMAQRGAINNPKAGLMIYQTDSTAGTYQFNGTDWKFLGGTNFNKASATDSGYISSADWNIFNNKQNALPSFTNGSVLFSNGSGIAQDNNLFFWDTLNKSLGIGSNTPDVDAALDVNTYQFGAIKPNNKGFLMPHVALENVNRIYPFTRFVKGMLVYNRHNPSSLFYSLYNEYLDEGVYFNDGSEWYKLLKRGDAIENITTPNYFSRSDAPPCNTHKNPLLVKYAYGTKRERIYEIKMNQAKTNEDGFLTKEDWNTFNNKQDALPAFKKGSLLFSNGTNISQDTNRLVWNDTYNNLAIGNNVADSNALLDLNSTNKGFLMPRLNTSQRNAIQNPTAGLMIYNTDFKDFQYFSKDTTYSNQTIGYQGGIITNALQIDSTQNSNGYYISVARASTLQNDFAINFSTQTAATLTEAKVYIKNIPYSCPGNFAIQISLYKGVSGDAYSDVFQTSTTVMLNQSLADYWLVANFSSNNNLDANSNYFIHYTMPTIPSCGGTFNAVNFYFGLNSNPLVTTHFYQNNSGSVYWDVGNVNPVFQISTSTPTYIQTDTTYVNTWKKIGNSTSLPTSLPTATNGQFMNYNNGNWQASSSINNTSTGQIGIGANATTTNMLTVNGQGGIRSYSTNNAPNSTDWIAGSFSGINNSDAVVMGTLNGFSTIGSHSSGLNGWRPLVINPGAETYMPYIAGAVDKMVVVTPSGSLSSQDIPTGNLGTVTNVTGNAPISVINNSSTPAISISQANTNTNGYLTSTDWNTFNNKGNFNLPTLTSGSILFSNGTSIAQNNSSLHWDNANARLSISGLNDGTVGAGYTNWISSHIGGSGGNRIVMGVQNGEATIGAHNYALNGWAGLTINPAGNVKMPSIAGSTNQMVVVATDGTLSSQTIPSTSADNLGNHTATQNINLGTNALVGNDGSNGIKIDSSGNVLIGASTTANKIEISGTGGLKVSSTNTGSGTTDWVASNVGGTSGDRVVSGNLYGNATIGAHTNALNGWSDLVINNYTNGGATVTIGNNANVSPTTGSNSDVLNVKLLVNGSVRQAVYSASVNLSANTATTITWNHNLGYNPVLMMSTDEGSSGNMIDVLYTASQPSANQTVFKIKNTGSTTATGTFKWILVW